MKPVPGPDAGDDWGQERAHPTTFDVLLAKQNSIPYMTEVQNPPKFFHLLSVAVRLLMALACMVTAALGTEVTPQFVPPPDTARDRLFNSGWLFHRGDIEGAQAVGFDDSNWRRLDLPHDWSIEPIPAGGEAAPVVDPVPGEWRYTVGDSDKHAAPGFDDSGWKTIILPAMIPDSQPATYCWFRREIELPKEIAGKDVIFDLGCIDDCDELYVNGEKVGDTGVMPKNQPQGNCTPAFREHRRYTVPAGLLKPGKNLVAICVYNNRKKGGFLPPKDGQSDRAEVFGPFSNRAIGGTHSGFTVGGTGWYRKHFTVDPADADKHFEILFGGIYMNSDVWINGQHLGFHPYGYSSINYDLTPHIKPGGENVIAVRVKNEGVTSRWYPGSGIYRNVWLTKTGPTRIRRWGVQILTPEANEQSANVILNTEVDGDSKGCELRVRLIDAQGKTVSEGTAKVEASPLTLEVRQPALWSVDHPNLYSANVRLLRDGKVIDEVVEPFGIRTISYSVDRGFLLNGEPVDMWGGCLHHDNGLLGSAAFDRAEYRKLEIMKQNGYNAVRASHNPMSDAFYDACDRLGLLVMDEAFDQWHVKKTPQDYGGETFEKWNAKDIELWLRRTRNHPCIVIRSLGNEIGNREKSEDELANILTGLKKEVARWDPTRPVTGGTAQAFDNHKYLGLYDVKGYNYREDKIEENHKLFPDWNVICTESFPSGNSQLETWNFVNERPWVSGSFVWSAFEYIGESWSGQVLLNGDEAGWPSYAAACGLIDITGVPKGGQLFRNVIDGTSDMEILVLEPPPEGRSCQIKPWAWPNEYPYWDWKNGQTLDVKVVSRAPGVRLKLNGKVVGSGTNSKDRIANVFKVPYEPGELVAEGLKDGKVIFSKTLKTPGKPVAIRLTSDRSPVAANRNDLAFVTVEVVDANGDPVKAGSHKVRYKVDGDGTLEACGNGCHKDVQGFRNAEAGTTWHGRSLAILRPSGNPGEMCLTVESDDFPAASLTVPVEKK